MRTNSKTVVVMLIIFVLGVLGGVFGATVNARLARENARRTELEAIAKRRQQWLLLISSLCQQSTIIGKSSIDREEIVQSLRQAGLRGDYKNALWLSEAAMTTEDVARRILKYGMTMLGKEWRYHAGEQRFTIVIASPLSRFRYTLALTEDGRDILAFHVQDYGNSVSPEISFLRDAQGLPVLSAKEKELYRAKTQRLQGELIIQ